MDAQYNCGNIMVTVYIYITFSVGYIIVDAHFPYFYIWSTVL